MKLIRNRPFQLQILLNTVEPIIGIYPELKIGQQRNIKQLLLLLHLLRMNQRVNRNAENIKVLRENMQLIKKISQLLFNKNDFM